MTDRIHNVLFLCTGNSARSILGEALLNHHGAGRFRAFSAGSHPKGKVHPMALEVLAELGLPTTALRSKSWDEFARPGAPDFDFIVTVCDDAAGEICPIWPGHPMTAHWGIDDPANVIGEGQRMAFHMAARYLESRIKLLLALPITGVEWLAMQRRLKEIGRTEGASGGHVENA